MLTENSSITLEQAIGARVAKHGEAISLMNTIETAQNAILSSQHYLNSDSAGKSYYKRTADYHLAQIEKQTTIRNEAINQYNSLMWQLYRAELPVFATTSIQEISVTLYSAHTVRVGVA